MRTAFRILLLLNVVCLGAVMLSGCTNDTHSSPGLVTRAVTFNIQWGTLTPSTNSAVLNAPSQARSASLQLVQASPDGSDLVFPAKRDPSKTDTYTQTYQVPSPVRVGQTILIAKFYLQPDPVSTDHAIGTLTSPQKVANTAAPTVINISTVTPPDSVVIQTGQTVLANHQAPLIFTPLAKDKVTVVPIDASANAVTSLVTSGVSYLQVVAPPLTEANASSPLVMAGQSASGTATVTITVSTTTLNGTVKTTSAPETVTVLPNIHVTVDPAPDPISVLTGTHSFTAHVTNVDNTTPDNPKVTWSVVGGAANGTIDPGTGLYTAPATIAGSPKTFSVAATSQADPSQSAQATITVQGGSGNVTIQ